MNKGIDVRWTLNDRDVVLTCQIDGTYIPATFWQPAEHPILEILDGEYADGQPLSEEDCDALLNDSRLYAEVEDEICKIKQGDWDNEVDRRRERLD